MTIIISIKVTSQYPSPVHWASAPQSLAQRARAGRAAATPSLRLNGKVHNLEDHPTYPPVVLSMASCFLHVQFIEDFPSSKRVLTKQNMWR